MNRRYVGARRPVTMKHEREHTAPSRAETYTVQQDDLDQHAEVIESVPAEDEPPPSAAPRPPAGDDQSTSHDG